MLEGDNRVRIIIAGLVLAAIAVGYMIFSQSFSSKSGDRVIKNTNQIEQIIPTPVIPPATVESSLSEFVVNPKVTKGGLKSSNVSTLPKTGFPVGLMAIFSTSVAIIGWGLRKYPN